MTNMDESSFRPSYENCKFDLEEPDIRAKDFDSRSEYQRAKDEYLNKAEALAESGLRGDSLKFLRFAEKIADYVEDGLDSGKTEEMKIKAEENAYDRFLDGAEKALCAKKGEEAYKLVMKAENIREESEGEMNGRRLKRVSKMLSREEGIKKK